MRLYILVGLFLFFGCTHFAWAKPEQQKQIIQNNSGTAINAYGNVDLTIIQQSTDYKNLLQIVDKAKRNAEKLPNDHDFLKELQQAEKNLTDFIEGIRNLLADIDKIPLNSERGKKALWYFEKGDYQQAREALDTKEMTNDKKALLKKEVEIKKNLEEIRTQKDNLAAEYLLKARLTAFAYQLGDDRIPQTRKYFEEALELGRTPECLFEYAFFLKEQNYFHDSEILYQEALRSYRKLAEANPRNLSHVARTLNNMGNLVQADSGRRIEAEKFFQEALSIRRDLAKANPQVYLPVAANTLNNLGLFVAADRGRRAEAEKLYQEALRTYRELAKASPQVYLPYLSGTINNMGILVQADRGRLVEAENLFKEALQTYRELAKANPQVYLPYVSGTLNNLGNVVKYDSGRRVMAENLLKEALSIRRDLAKANPEAHLPLVARSLYNLGNVFKDDRDHRDEAEKLYKEALSIYRELAKANPQVYLPFVANTLRSFGYAYLNWQQPLEARIYLNEAIDLLTLLSEKAPQIFKDKLEFTQQLLQYTNETN